MGVVKYGQGIFGVSTLALHLAYRLRAKRKSLSALSKTKEPIGFE
jgi:hypothetical protein